LDEELVLDEAELEEELLFPPPELEEELLLPPPEPEPGQLDKSAVLLNASAIEFELPLTTSNLVVNA
jgi:hypothetical protein